MSNTKLPAATLHEELIEALRDALAGWRYIRMCHGDLYGVGWDRVEDKATAALARADRERQAGEAAAWMPIETAPKDGTVILLCAEDQLFEGKARVSQGSWSAPSETPRLKYVDGFAPEPVYDDWEPYWASYDGGFTEEHPPTHWMPLPAAPGVASLPAPKAVQAELSDWSDTYAAFVAAFDTPLARRRQDDEYAQDARRRMREMNERIVAAAPSPDGKAGPGFPLSLMGRAKAVGDEAARLAQRLASKTSHFEEQPDGTVTPVDPADRGFKAEQAEAPAFADPTDPGHDVAVLREHVRHLERRIRQLHATQPTASPEQAEAPSDYRECEFCHCNTDASWRWCCINGAAADALATQPTASNAGERNFADFVQCQPCEMIDPDATCPQCPGWLKTLDDQLIEDCFQEAAGADEETHLRFAHAVIAKFCELNRLPPSAALASKPPAGEQKTIAGEGE